MAETPLPDNEQQRLQTLQEHALLDTPKDNRFERITKIARALFNVPIVGISLIDERRQWFKSIQGTQLCETKREYAFCSHTIRQDEPLIINDSLQDTRFHDNPYVLGQPYIRFYAGCPIKANNDHNLGTICLIDTKPGSVSAEQIEYLQDIARIIEAEIQRQAFYNIQNELLREIEIDKKARLIDPLTKLANRAGMWEILDHQMTRSQISGKSFGLVLADVDHFKQINDHYGHSAGDEVLRQIGKTLITYCRAEDAVSRWGGEEFLILINAEKFDCIMQVAERLREAVENMLVLWHKKSIRVTMTMGVKRIMPHQSIQLDGLIEQADKALYQGKLQGRNKVIA